MMMEALFPGGVKLTLKDRSFRQMIEYIHEKPGIKEHEPICLYFPTTKKYLVYKKELFLGYLKDEIEQTELIEDTQCDGLFRNRNLMETHLGESVDKDSLWKKQGEFMILVDDDSFVTSNYFEENFYKVE